MNKTKLLANLFAVSNDARNVRFCEWALLLAALGATPWPSRWMARLRRGTWTGKVVAVAEPLVLAALLVISTGYLVDGGVQPFWY